MRKQLLATLLITTSITANDFNDFNDFNEFEKVEKIQKNKSWLIEYNEWMTGINYEIYSTLFIPLINMYEKVPVEIRDSIDNMLNNVLKPTSILNNFLQLKGEETLNETKIFVVNTSLGLFGVFDVAEENFKLEDTIETFRETANKYNIPKGEYIVLPIIGSTTIRDSILDLMEYQYNKEIFPNVDVNKVQNVFVVDSFNKQKENIKQIKIIKDLSNEDKNKYIKNKYIKIKKNK